MIITPNVVSARDTFTLVILPDTQRMSATAPEVYTNQTQWIVDNEAALNIQYVIHVGDIVNNWNLVAQWNNANTSMSILDNIIPYSVVPGNHDGGDYVYYESYFGLPRFSGWSYYGLDYPTDTNRNNYAFFNASGEEFIVIGFDFCGDNTALEWVNNTMTTYESMNKIFVTHNYMFYDGTRGHDYSSWGCAAYTGESGNSGDEIFYKVIRHHTKVRMVLSGHILGDGLGYKMDVVNGYPTHQILQNYQAISADNGFLRYYTFDLDNNNIDAYSYSPYQNIFNTTAKNQFSMYWNIPNS